MRTHPWITSNRVTVATTSDSHRAGEDRSLVDSSTAGSSNIRLATTAPAHPLARRGSATLAELAGEAWIVREPGSGTRETLDQALRHHHSAMNIRLELEHTEAIKRAVEFGLGIGCISRLALREAFRRGSLVAIETPELDLRRDFQFLWQRRKFQTVGMREFIGLCRAMTAGCERSDQIEWSFIP